jgi:hypothetical protein
MLEMSRSDKTHQLRQHYLGFPENLPDLSKLKPPGGNERPEGIADSHYERRERGQLPEFY